MKKVSEKAFEVKSLGMAKLIGGSFLALILAATLTAAQFDETQKNEQPAEQALEQDVLTDIDNTKEVSVEAGECSTATLSSTPNSKQLSCLMDVKAQFGTFDCQSTGWFETHLKADIELCEAKVSACMSDKPMIKVKASAQKSAERQLPLIIKREPAKLIELGRAESPSETSSYFIQCDDKEVSSLWVEK